MLSTTMHQAQSNGSTGCPAKCCLAKAKFDNLAEAADELAFKKGDILTVIEQNLKGLDGWWLCSLRGRQGIAPSNRLSLLAGLYNMDSQLWANPAVNVPYQIEQSEYDVPRSYNNTPNVSRSSSAHEQITPSLQDGRKAVRELLYDIPRSLERLHLNSNSSPATEEVYDTPQSQNRLRVTSSIGDAQSTKSAVSPGYRSNTDSAFDMQSDRSSFLSCNSSPPASTYDSSRSSMELLDIYDVPNPKAGKRNVLVKQSSLSEGLYDVPKSVREREQLDKANEKQDSMETRDSGIYDNAKPTSIPQTPNAIADKIIEIYDQPSGKLRRINSLKGHNSEGVYDVPPQVMRDSSNKSTPNSTLERKSSADHESSPLPAIDLTQYEELPLELEAAVEILIKLQQDVNTSTSRLLSFVRPGWRRRQNLETIMYDLKISCIGLQNTVQEFIDFGTGALANSAKLADMTIAQRLGHHLMPLQDKLDTINKNMKSLSFMKWHLAKLEDTGDRSVDKDELSQVLLCARQVSEDTSRIASVIHGNSTLIFKRSITDQKNRPLPSVPTQPSEHETKYIPTRDLLRDASIDSCHEYDYCELQETKIVSSTPKTVPSTVQPMHYQDTEEDKSDREYLDYYLLHVSTIGDQVKDYVDKMYMSIKQNDSPQVLVANSKLLVSCAHKIVYIGDTLSRILQVQQTRTVVTNSANNLCSCLKDAIVCTKDAALAASPGNRTRAMEKLKDSATHVLHAVIAFQGSMSSRNP